MSAFSLFLIIFCLCTYSEKIPYIPGITLLPPCLATAAFIYFSENSKVIKRILGFSILVRIGLLSYSLYLWHWVVISFTSYVIGKENQGVIVVLLQVFMMIGLSVLGYFLVEKPVRYSKITFKKSLLLIYLLPTLLLVISNYFVRNHIKKVDENLSSSHILIQPKERESKIIVIGDSHSDHLRGFLNYVGSLEGWKADILNDADRFNNITCKQTFEAKEYQSHNCLKDMDKLIQHYPIVFVSFFYDLYSGGYPVPRTNPRSYLVDNFYAKFKLFIEHLAKEKQVYVFSNVPALSYSPLRYMHLKSFGLETFLPKIKMIGNITESNQKIFNQIKDIPNVHWVDINTYLPSYYHTESEVVYSDQDHLTNFGSTQIGINFSRHKKLLPDLEH